MSEEVKSPEPEVKTPEDDKGQMGEVPSISNADLKAHPVFQKLTSQVAAYERAEQERREEAAKAAQEAEIKALEDQKRYDEVIKLKDQEIQATVEKFQNELLTLNLKNELVKAGFHNDHFVKGVVSDFQGTQEEIDSYVQSVLNDEKNKPFLASSQNQQSYVPPSTPGVASMNDTVPIETLKAWENSSDREERIKARAYLSKYRQANGKYPY